MQLQATDGRCPIPRKVQQPVQSQLSGLISIRFSPCGPCFGQQRLFPDCPCRPSLQVECRDRSARLGQERVNVAISELTKRSPTPPSVLRIADCLPWLRCAGDHRCEFLGRKSFEEIRSELDLLGRINRLRLPTRKIAVQLRTVGPDNRVSPTQIYPAQNCGSREFVDAA